MNTCQRCKSRRVVKVSGKTNDMCFVMVLNRSRDGYVPRDMNIGDGDYLRFHYCLECGQMQGKWPLATTELEDA